jgi:hypothetical protein
MSLKKPFRAVPIILGPRYRRIERRAWLMTVTRAMGLAILAGILVALLSAWLT